MKVERNLWSLAIMLIVPALVFASENNNAGFSMPFPLSLIEYPAEGGPVDPWAILDVDNIQINSDGTGQVQNEEMVCVNPTNTANAVALWRDFREGYRRIGFGYTFDGGQSWVDTLLVVPPHPRQSDPVLTVDDEGNFFACSLCLPWDGSFSGIYVQKSTDGGMSWSDPVVVVDSNFAYFEDKQWITVDRTATESNGNIYIPWARFDADLSRNRVSLCYSHDHGQTYGEPVVVSEGRAIQWPTVTVGPSGVVYVAWYSGWPAGIYMDVSYDYGETFGTDQFVDDIATGSTDINGGILVFPFPALASDINPESPFLGNLYLVHMDRNGSDMDIFLLRSEDGGQTWSDRIRINDDPEFNGADQFHPWISVDDSGVIHVIFYDRRLDHQNMLFDLYYTKSEDGGDTWSANERITTVSSDPRQARLAGLIGEYIGLSAWQGEVQMVWTDVRNGNQDVFSGRMTPTSVGDMNAEIPSGISLKNPYPNPFNSDVSITFYASSEKNVRLDLFDILGRRIATLFDGEPRPGLNRLSWNGRNEDGSQAASGVYFVKLISDSEIRTKKAILLR